MRFKPKTATLVRKVLMRLCRDCTSEAVRPDPVVAADRRSSVYAVPFRRRYAGPVAIADEAVMSDWPSAPLR